MKFIIISLMMLLSFQLQAKDIIPLAVGNVWHFVNPNNPADVEKAEVLEQIEHAGQTWFKYRELSDDDIFYVSNGRGASRN